MKTTTKFSKFSDEVSKMAVVIAFDPGETTGFAVLGVRPAALTCMQVELEPLHESLDHIEYGEIDCGARHGETGVGMQKGYAGMNLSGENMGIDRMVLMLRYYWKPAIVIEDFIVDFNQITMTRSALSPVRVTAAFSYAHKDKLASMFLQNRANVKTTCNDQRLKTWGLYDSHSGPHARDAVRHGFYFLRTCRGASTDAAEKRHMAWPHLFPDPLKTNVGKTKKAPKPLGERVIGLG